jgi:orotate phosphoribosyltransferase
VKVVEALRNNGCKVLVIVTILDFGFPSTRRKLNNLGVDLTALTNLDTVLHHATHMGMINSEEQQAIKEWQSKPSKWTK